MAAALAGGALQSSVDMMRAAWNRPYSSMVNYPGIGDFSGAHLS